MAKYRKKPVVVQAQQWFPGTVVEGVQEVEHPGVDETGQPKVFQARCWTLEGTFGVTRGDWIITGVEGEKYPCKPSIFEKTYEAVESVEGDEIDKVDAILYRAAPHICGVLPEWNGDLDAGVEAMAKRIAALEKALAFTRCVIKSGEKWTPTCASVIDGALGITEEESDV